MEQVQDSDSETHVQKYTLSSFSSRIRIVILRSSLNFVLVDKIYFAHLHPLWENTVALGTFLGLLHPVHQQILPPEQHSLNPTLI